LIEELNPVINPDKLIELQNQVDNITVSDTLYEYLQDLVEATRQNSNWTHGLSPRGGLALLKAAKAWAVLDNRKYVQPEDIQAVWGSVTEHRLLSQVGNVKSETNPVDDILAQTAIPR